MATIIRIGSQKNPFPLEFKFESGMAAYTFYSDAIDHYREDDLIIVMTEEGEDNERI